MEAELKTFEFPVSALTKSQSKIIGVRQTAEGEFLTVKIRYDDECNNGHNTFAITGELRRTPRGKIQACGCLHEDIEKTFPELEKYIKWHLCSSDGPMYYIANTLYWIKEGNIEYARSTAVWPEMPECIGAYAERIIKLTLIERLPELMKAFKADMEALGFKY